MDASRRVLAADVLVRDGRIVEIVAREAGASKGRRAPSGPSDAERGQRRSEGQRGAEGDAGPRRRVRILDAAGAIVVPGFVQTHVHLCQALFRGMADELPLLDWLRERIWPLEAAHDEASLAASAALGVAEMMRAGTTTILDMGTVHHHDAVFETLAASRIRAVSGKAMMDRGLGVPKGLRESTKDSLRETERLIARWHGAEGGRLRYALAPRFILSCSEKLLRASGEIARATGTLVHSHAAEHPGEKTEVRAQLGMDDVDALASYGLAGPHVVLAHGVQLSRAQMRRCGKDGTRFVHCPSANLKLASGIADVVAMREAGMTVGLGADGAPCNNRMDPFTELRQAALLAKVVRKDAAALSPMDALAMLTIEGARVLGLEAEVGSIEVGKRADLTVVRLDGLHAEPHEETRWGDPVARLVYSATASDVSDVIIDGVPVVVRGELLAMDERTVREDARRHAVLVHHRARLS
ncbi:MAG: amidohydrolase family protein [Sandaracinaceae bacterium]|nr:amidohydrolase family protein [Sandaracinaceae bacterium]